jgi:hypothetical protein
MNDDEEKAIIYRTVQIICGSLRTAETNSLSDTPSAKTD